MGCQEVGTDRDLGGREASVPVATPSHNRGESLSQSHLQPPLRQVALRLKDARPCRILQCRYLSNLAGANSHRRSLSLLLTPRENRSCPKPLAIMRVPCCPCSRVAPRSPHPWRITASTRELSKVTQSCPTQNHSRLAFCAAQHREWLRSGERSVPPTGQTFHCEF